MGIKRWLLLLACGIAFLSLGFIAWASLFLRNYQPVSLRAAP